MHRILFTLILFFFLSETVKSQDYSWITPNKAYLKMYVADDGIYRINKTDFTNAGINTTGLDPRTVKVLYRGSQIPIFFQGESDGAFDVSDYFDFYGTRNYGGPTKTYNEDNAVVFTTNEYYNSYSDTNAYWIDWGGSNGVRMTISDYVAPEAYPLNYYYDIIHLEKDRIFWLGEYLTGFDFGSFSNERFKGESWYWSLLGSGQFTEEVFSTPLLHPVAQTASVRIYAYPVSMSTGIPNENTIQIRINNNVVGTITINDVKKFDSTFTFSSSLLTSSGTNTARATYISNGGFSGQMFFDLFEITYPKNVKFQSNQTLLRMGGADTTSKLFKISGFVPANPTSIYDVNNGIKINTFSSNADTLKFSGKGNSKFEVINKNITKKPLRIIQRQVPDFVTGTNGADYLLVYNSLFETQASQLKSHREAKDNFRVTKAEVQNIYDVFNYGIEDPVAVRNFVRHVYYNWQTPRIKYLCLFGRGSLDPKKNSVSTLYEKNLIPAVGNPSSDNYYSNVNTSGFAYYSNVSIGRLPAYTVSEAQSMVDNIISYESQSPASWDKSFTFIGGGINASEQTLFLALNDSLIIPYINPPPVSGNPVRILRNDLNGGVTFNYPDSIKNQINRGTLTVNFMGHAGYQDWELAMNDPSVLSNYNGALPLVFSMTCYTGKIGEPNFRSFGEEFMIMANRGAIGFVGTSGWSYIGAGGQLNTNMYKAMCRDTVRRIGDIFSNSIYNMRKDSALFNVRHTINCYTLQGDPAVKLLLPAVPDYSIRESDYKISTNNPVVNENVTFTAYPKNFGLYSDSCNVRFQISEGKIRSYLKDTTIRNFKFVDSLKFNFSFESAGSYTAEIILDNNNLNPNENKSDNILSVRINTRDVSFIPLMPVNNQVISTDSVEFTGLNPLAKRLNNTITLILEMDTTLNFNSQIKKSFFTGKTSGVSTKFKTILPVLDSNVVYYWRTNSIINDDTTGWSQTQIFRYKTGDVLSREIMPPDSSISIYKNKANQYNVAELSNTSYFGIQGIKLSEYSGVLKVRSFGSSGAEASYFNVLDKSIHIDAGGNTGLNLLKVRKTDGSILSFKNIKMTLPQSNDTVLSYLNTFDTTHYLLGLNASYVGGGMNFTSQVKSKFGQFGSTKKDSFVVGFFDTWAFIGYLNAPLNDVYEEVHKYNNSWIQSVGSLTRTFKRTTGSVSYTIGPSSVWKDFSWENQILSGSGIKFDVYGINKTEQHVLILSNLTTNNFVDLSGINAYTYPKLNLVGRLNIDTLTGTQSSVLNSFKLNYTAPAEIVADINSFWRSDSVLVAGQELKLKFDYYNEGSVGIPGVIVNIYKSDVSGDNIIRTDTIVKQLSIESSLNYYEKFTVPYIRPVNGKAQLVVEVLPLGQNNEFYTFNNYYYMDIVINAVSANPDVQLFSNGNLIQSGDYVSLNPEFRVSINSERDNQSFSDTSKVLMLLNNKYVLQKGQRENYSALSKSNNTKSNVFNNSQNSRIFYPELIPGENKIRIIYRNGNNEFDSTDYVVIVSEELQIRDFYNYPNPMKNETSFIFNLVGLETPFNCKIKIYTIGGRMIRELNHTPSIGINQIYWDGKDSDGDFIANGTYLYKFVSEDSFKKETAVQKLVILR